MTTKQRPTLRTERLVLRPFTLEDAPAVQWIATHQADFDEERVVHFAIDDGQFTGAIGLVFKGDRRVLQKIGMTYEGTLRQHLRKWDEYLDLACYGALREEWKRTLSMI